MVPEGGRTPGDNEGAPGDGAWTAGIDVVDGVLTAGIDVVDGVLTAGIDVVDGVLTAAGIDVVDGVFTAGMAAVEGLFEAAGATGILTAGLLVDDGRAAGASALVAITVFDGWVVVAATVRAATGLSDPCGCTGGPLIEGGGTESSA
jgi:hypothetical protein